MDRKLLKKAKEIEMSLEQVDKVIRAIENKDFECFSFALCVDVYGHSVPFKLPSEMTNEILDVCHKYRLIYEEQLEEL